MPQGRVAIVESPETPASWVFVVGHRFLAAVPTRTNRGVVERLTERVYDARIDVESIVALLPLTGPDAVTSFLVVVTRDASDADGVPVSAVVRGGVVADVFSVGGSRRFSDRGIRPWLLADFRAVTGLVLGSGHAPVLAAGGLGAGQLVGLGISTGNALIWSMGHPGGAPFPGDHESGTAFDTVIGAPRALDHDDTVLRAPSEHPESYKPDADTVIRPPRTVRHGGLAGGLPPLAVPFSSPEAPPGPVGGRAPLNLGREPVRKQVVPSGFQLSPGDVYRLDQPYLVGRNPRLPRIVIGDDPRLLTVPSPTSAVSSTHLDIRQEGDSIVVTDLGSTNGTVVRPPHGRTRRLRSGQSLAVTPGTVVEIGDGNIVQILR